MTNTEFRILSALDYRGDYGCSAMDLANQFYPQSRQLVKKCKTMLRHCQTMNARGWVNQTGGAMAYLYTEVRFTLSLRGREMGIAHQNLRRPQGVPWICGPRLADPSFC